MERYKEYTTELGDKNKEKIIHDFLFKNANIVRFTKVEWESKKTDLQKMKWRKIKKCGGENDPKFVAVLKNFQEDFIKKVINNKRYGDVPQSFLSEHYFYRFSPKIKNLINQEGLIIVGMFSKNFHGFEDLAFYKDNQKIGCVISHHREAVLYLTEREKKYFEKNGIKFY